MNESVDFEYASIVIRNGIMECYYKPLPELGLDIAQEMVKERVKMASGISYPCLFDLSSIAKVTQEARDYLAKDGNAYVKASALIVSSPMVKMLANFFVAVNKPVSPTRLFTSKEPAIKWLQQFKD